jgi:outer membrane immunogenic protein
MRSILVSVAMIALGAPAFAADLPMKAPPSPAAIVAYNWSGIYFGGHVGYGTTHTVSNAATTSALFPAGTSFASDSDGFLGGGQVGFNVQYGSWVVGAEGDFSWTDASSSATLASPFVPAINGIGTAKVDWYATLAGRIGYAFGPTLLYVKGGGAWMNVDYSAAVSGLLTGTSTVSATRSGWMVGAGLEYGFAGNWSVKAEYNYLDFGSDGFTFVPLPAFPAVPYNVDSHAHLFKFGLNYRFNMAGLH